MEFIDFLPNWIMTEAQAMAHDTESATGIEMVAKVYAKMQELIRDYNEEKKKREEDYKAFKTAVNNDIEVFKTAMLQKYQEHTELCELEFLRFKTEIRNKLNEGE